jgi:hypothetical protein
VLLLLGAIFISRNQTVGRLQEALEHYKRSKRYGVDRAAVHIKDVSLTFLFLPLTSCGLTRMTT